MATKLPSVASAWPSVTISVTLVSFVLYSHIAHPHSGSALKSDIELIYREIDRLTRDAESVKATIGEMRERIGGIRRDTPMAMISTSKKHETLGFAYLHNKMRNINRCY